MMRYGVGLTWLLFLTTRVAANAAMPDTLICPPDLRYRSLSLTMDDHKILAEWCVDSLNRKQGPLRGVRTPSGTLDGEASYQDGMLHGALKKYDAQGILQSITQYDHGIEKSFYMTNAGIRHELAERNQDLENKNHRLTMSLTDDRRLTYQVTLSTASPTSKGNVVLPPELTMRLCGLIQEMGLNGIDYRVQNEHGSQLRSTSVNPSDCTPNAVAQ